MAVHYIALRLLIKDKERKERVSLNIKFKKETYAYPECKIGNEIAATIPEGCVTTYRQRVNGWYQLDTGLWVYEYDNLMNRVIIQTPVITNTNIKRIKYNKEILEKYNFNLQRFATGQTKYSPEVAPNGNHYEENDIEYWTNQINPDNGANYSRSEAIKILSQDEKYTESSYYQSVKQAVVGSISSAANAVSAFTGISIGSHSTEYHGMDLRVSSIKGIFGVPYQFMPTVDNRIENNGLDSLGRIYTNKIIARIPLLVMVPGVPEFLKGYDDDTKIGALNNIIDEYGGGSGASIDDIVKQPGKYYGLKSAWPEYYTYVDAMCHLTSVYMGVDGTEYNGSTLNDFHWGNNLNSDLQAAWGYQGGSAFYVNSETQISEGFSNSSTQSQLTSKINEMSDYARELNFLLGTADSMVDPTKLTGAAKDKILGTDASAKELKTDSLAGKGIISGLMNALGTVMHGGKIIFPEIWADSQFSRDYSIDIKLVSPDCDDLSVYLNIVVPLIHLMGFVMPRAAGPNGFISPFLVRASYKSFFNIDMGLITNMNITKGTEGGWNSHGVPTVVDVNFTIKELYDGMAMSNMVGGTWMLTANTNLQDYLANLCGVNINDGDVERTIKSYMAMQGSRPGDFLRRNTIDRFNVWINDKLYDLFHG